jgi:general secretion pathway protein L
MEFTAHMEAVSVVAVGLALEGIKRPRNPAINLRKDEFALENESLKRFWQTWQLPIQIGVAMFAIFFVFAVVRDSMAGGLNDKADEHVNEMAKKVAGLKGAAATQTGVESHISKQKKLIRDREALSKAENVNSAMDVLAKIAGKVPVIKPPRTGVGLNVSHLNIDNDNVKIEGSVDIANVKILETALTEIAKPKTFKRESSAPPGASGVPFAYSFKVERTKL